MSHCFRILLAGLTLTPVLGCSGDSLPASCSLTTTPLGANALTLLGDARLDRAGPGFVLLGTDGQSVFWQTVDVAGTAGALQSVVVPAHTDGPWFGVVGTAAAPGNQVVVTFAASPTAGMATLLSFAVGIDGTGATSPAAIGTIPDRAATAAALLVSAGSGQGGQHMGLMWATKGSSTVSAKILGPGGAQVGGDVSLGTVDDIDCPRFASGRGDLTATFVRTSGTPPIRTFAAREFDADGKPAPGLDLQLLDWSADEAMGCVAVSPSTSGYGVAWRANSSSFSGDYFALYDPAAGVSVPTQILSDERVSGGHASPVVALGKVGSGLVDRFIVVIAQNTGGQAWEVDFRGHPIAQSVTFPSTRGNTGTFSTQPLGGSLFVTYADYSSALGTDHSQGSRLFAEVTCK